MKIYTCFDTVIFSIAFDAARKPIDAVTVTIEPYPAQDRRPVDFFLLHSEEEMQGTFILPFLGNLFFRLKS